MTELEAAEIAKDIYMHHFDDDIKYPDVLKAITVGVKTGCNSAREIIKDLLSLKATVSSAEDVKKRFSVRERAEQFLKEE